MHTCTLPLKQYFLRCPVGNLTLVTCSNGLHGLNYKDDELIKTQNEENESNCQAKQVMWIQGDERGQENIDVHALTCFNWLKCYFENPSNVATEQFPQFCFLDESSKDNSATFTIKVLRNLLEIPSGKTVSYSELAEISGNPKASRAVGSAMKRNPCAIVIPCHRVLPKVDAKRVSNCEESFAKRSVGEYAGGRSHIKQWLLNFEANNSASN